MIRLARLTLARKIAAITLTLLGEIVFVTVPIIE
jgi:hypothetical protein